MNHEHGDHHRQRQGQHDQRRRADVHAVEHGADTHIAENEIDNITDGFDVGDEGAFPFRLHDFRKCRVICNHCQGIEAVEDAQHHAVVDRVPKGRAVIGNDEEQQIGRHHRNKAQHQSRTPSAPTGSEVIRQRCHGNIDDAVDDLRRQSEHRPDRRDDQILLREGLVGDGLLTKARRDQGAAKIRTHHQVEHIDAHAGNRIQQHLPLGF